MPDSNIPLTNRVDALNRPQKMYFDELLKQSDDAGIFKGIKSLRKDLAEDAIEGPYKEAALLALISMEAHLAGDSAPRPMTDAEALQDMQARIKQAAADGDQSLLDSLKRGLAHVAEKAIAADELHQKRTAALAAQNQAHEGEQKARYESMLKDWKDSEIMNLRRGGMDLRQAESHYEQFSAAPMEDIARKTTGYSYREPIEE